MKRWSLILLAATFLTVTALPASATLADCRDVFVKQIRIYEGGIGVIFAETPNGVGPTSYYSYLNNLSADTRKGMLSLLYFKKASGEPLGVKTDAPGGCGIANGGTYILELQSEAPYFF